MCVRERGREKKKTKRASVTTLYQIKISVLYSLIKILIHPSRNMVKYKRSSPSLISSSVVDEVSFTRASFTTDMFSMRTKTADSAVIGTDSIGTGNEKVNVSHEKFKLLIPPTLLLKIVTNTHKEQLLRA